MSDIKIEVFTIKDSFTFIQQLESDSILTYEDVIKKILSDLAAGIVIIESYKSNDQLPEIVLIPREKVESIKIKPLVIPT